MRKNQRWVTVIALSLCLILAGGAPLSVYAQDNAVETETVQATDENTQVDSLEVESGDIESEEPGTLDDVLREESANESAQAGGEIGEAESFENIGEDASLSLQDTAEATVNVSVFGQQMYSYAFKVLDLVNKERKKAGVEPVTMDKDLLEAAMLRSYETAIYFSHTRPNGTDCSTVSSKTFGENIAAGLADPSSVMGAWMGSSGHKTNILDPNWTSVGIGCVMVYNSIYWVQCFSWNDATAVSASSYKDSQTSRTVSVSKNKAYYRPSLYLYSSKVKAGKKSYVVVKWNNGFINEFIYPTNAVIKSSNTSVCTVKDGVIRAKKAGTAKITMYYPGYESYKVTKTIKVTGKAAKTTKYKVTFNANGGTATKKSKTVKKNAKIGTLPKATKEGYKFKGWYTKKSGGKKITKSTKIKKKQTVYAHWKK